MSSCWTDLTFTIPQASVTRLAGRFNLSTNQVFKVPAAGMVVMRICGPRENMKQFLIAHFKDDFIVRMHLRALKNGQAPIPTAYKNLGLRENREQ